MAFRQIKTPALANQAVIETKLDVTAVSGQTPVASISAPSLDSFLIHDTTSGALRKVTASSFIGSFDSDSLGEGTTNLYFTDVRAQTAVAADIASAVATEATDRAAADTTLQGNIDTLSGEVDATQLGAGLGTDGTYSADATTNYLATATSLVDADGKLDAAIKAVDTAYQAADTSLQNQVDFITNNVDPAALDSLTEIVSSFQTADTALEASVIANTGLITTETTRATGEEARIEGKVDATQSELDATQVGSGLAADGSYTASTTANYIATSTSLHGATVAIDTAVKAVDTAYKAADTTLQTSITANANKIGTAALDTTATDLSAGLNEVHGEVDAEASRALTAEGVIAANLVTETNARAAADTSIRTDFAAADSDIQGELDATQLGAGLEADGSFMAAPTSTYTNAAVSLKDAIEVLDSSLAIEEDARIVADGNLDTRLTTEEGNVDTLQTEVQAIEDVLGDIGSTPLDTTATTIGGAINEVHGEVDALDTRLTTTEGDIATNLASINDIISNTDPAALDSLAEIVSAFQTADTTLTGLVNANAAAVNTVEASVGLNADGTYAPHTTSNYIDSATSTKAALGLLDTQAKTNADAIAAETTARVADVDAEETRATAAEGAIQTELDATQTGLGIGADGTYTPSATANHIATATSMVDADNKLDAAIKVVQDNLDAEITTTDGEMTALQGRVTTNEGDIASATTDRANIRSEFAAADLTLQGNIDTLSGEVDDTQTGAGLAADGSYVANTTSNYLPTATSLKDATEKLDTQSKVNADAIAAEIVDREADVDAEQARAEGEEARIETKIDNEVTRSTAADAVHTADILTNAGNITTLDGRMTTAEGNINIEKGRIDDILQGADGALDTLKEIGDAFAAADSSLQTLITNNGTAITTLNNEMDAVEGDISSLETLVGDIASTPLATTATSIGGAINELHGEIDANLTEVANTQAALGLNADGSYSAHTGSNFLDTAATMKGALTALDSAIATNANAITTGDAAVTTAFQAADTSIISDYEAADVVLTQAIDTAESSIGLNADGSYTAPATSNYLGTTATVKAGLVALDTQAKANADNLTTEIADRISAVTAEATARGNADTTLQNNIDTESARAQGVEGALDTRLTSAEGEITATQTGAGLAADGTYAADATTNYLSAGTSLKDADKKLDTAIKTADDRAIAAEGALDTRLTTAEGEVDSLQTFTGEGTALDTTSATLAGAVNEMHGESDAIDARLTVAEGDIATNLASINNIISNTDPAALDSLTEIVTEFQNADSTLTGLVTANLNEINAIETGAGLGTDGTYTAPAGTNYLATASSLSNADEALDTAIKAVDTAYKAADAAHDTAIAARLEKAGGTMAGAIDMGSNGISNVAAPTLAGDAVNLGYLTSSLSSQHISAFTSDDLAEGAGNLYYLDSRSRAAISLVDSTTRGGVASYNSSTGVISVNADHSVLDATDVTDTTFTGQEGKVLAVNGAETGMELIDVSHLAFASANRITINGDGTTQTFALGFDTTQVAAMVFVGGVVQDPTTHYSIDSTAGTITFNDPIPTGSQAVVISHMLGAVPYLETASVTFDKFSADIKAYVQQSAVTATNGGTPVDTFSGTAYRSAKYIIQVDNGAGEYETREALVVHDGTTAYITEYALVYTGAALLGDATVAMNGNDVQLFYTSNGGNVTVKVISTYIDV